MTETHKHPENEEEKSGDGSDRDEGSNKLLIISIIIVLVIFLAIFSMRFIAKPNTEVKTAYTYNGFAFTQLGGLWYTEIENQKTGNVYNIPLHFGPKDVENITITGKLSKSFYSNETFITHDPSNTQRPGMQYIALSAAELSINLVQVLNLTPVAACTSNSATVCEQRPIITCDLGKPTIYIKEDPVTSVALNDTCIIIQGNGTDLIRATDRLIYQLYGVMS